MIRDYDSGSDSDGDIEVNKLSFPYDKRKQKSIMFQSILSSCKKKFKNVFSRILDGVDDYPGLGGFADFEDEICEKFGYNESARTFVHLIEDWKKYIDKYVFYPKGEHPLHAVDFLHCIVLSDRGYIDYAKSAKNLLNEEKLNEDDKIKIACLHCLRDKIIGLAKAKSIPQQFSGKIYTRTRRIMQFWKTYLVDETYSESIEKLIKLVGYDNRDALMFFWEKLTDSQKSRVIVDVFSRARVELQLQWLDEATEEEQKFVMRKCGGCVLINIMESEWRHKFFEAATFARYLLSSKHYYEVIKAASSDISVAKSGHWNELPFKAFHFLWKRAPKHVKDYIYQQKGTPDFFWYVKKRGDYGFFKRFFDQAPSSFKRRYLETSEGMQTLSYIYTEDDYPELFHHLIKSAFPREEDAVDFKIKFMSEEYGNYIIDDFVGKKDRNPFEDRLRGMFFTDEAANKFKRHYMYESKAHVLGEKAKLVFYADERRGKFRSKLVFRHILEYVRWFLPEEEIDTFKKIALCQNKNVKRVFLELIRIGRYDLVDRFLKWSMADNQLIAEYKSNFYTDDLRLEFLNLIVNFVRNRNNLERLLKFDKWCAMSPENRRNLGDWILKNSQGMLVLPMWRHLLYEGYFDMATNFLKFCGKNTEEEMKKAKNELLCEINMIYILHGVWRRGDIDEEQNKKPKVQAKLMAKADRIFDWFMPITELTYLIVECKELEEESYELKKFHKILSYLN